MFFSLRKENDNNMNINITDESKSSLNIKFYQMKKILYSNQTISHQIKQKISLVDKNSSVLLNQISTIDKHRIHLIEHIDSLHNKWLVIQQEVLNSLNKFNRMKYLSDLNNQKHQRFIQEKQNIILFLLEKQRLIVLVNKHIELNDKNLNRHRSCYIKLMNQIRQMGNKVLREIQSMKPFEKQPQLDMKQVILRLRKELLEYKKKNNDFQHRINRQILTNANNKSTLKGIYLSESPIFNSY